MSPGKDLYLYKNYNLLNFVDIKSYFKIVQLIIVVDDGDKEVDTIYSLNISTVFLFHPNTRGPLDCKLK